MALNGLTRVKGSSIDTDALKIIPTVAHLKENSIYADDDTVIYVGGYSEFNSEGFLLVRDADEDNTVYKGSDWNDNGIVNSKLLAFDADGLAFSLSGNFLKLSWLGAEDSADIGSILNYAITYLKSLAIDTLLDIDVVSCTSTVQPPVLNSGYTYCVGLTSSRSVNNGYHITFTTGDIPIKYSGGSGALAGNTMSNLYLRATDNQVLEIKGTCGAIFDGCKFRSDTVNPVDLTNDSASGTFTEFVKFRSCIFQGIGLARFIRGAGNDSFHGCNFDDNCVVNLFDDSEWIFQFGDGTNTEVGRIIWYNGECSATMFYSGDNQLELFYNGTNTTSYENFVILNGRLKSEFDSDWCATLSTNISVSLANAPMELTKHFSFYGCYITPKIAVLSNGAKVIEEGWKELYVVKESTDDFDSFYLGLPSTYFPYQADVEIIADNYQAGYTLLVAGRPSTSISPTVTVLANWRLFNSAGYGAVTFTMDTTEDDVYITPASSWADAEVKVKMIIRGVRTQSTWIAVDDQDTSVTEYTA